MYLTENWRLKEQRYALKGTRNNQTQEVNFPPRPVTVRPLAVYDFGAEQKPQNGQSVVEETLAEAV